MVGMTRCKLIQPWGRCDQTVEPGSSLCYYHNKVLKGIIEPHDESYYMHPANAGFRKMRRELEDPEPDGGLLTLIGG
ncbi:MAG: hypothetical protein AB1384_12545 [Actinomycetota bacterium]